MIRIQVLEKNQSIERIVIKGHADYDVYGHDIVCAAVSATYLCTINACLLICEQAIRVESSVDCQEIFVIGSDAVVQKLLLNMIHCLDSLRKEYPKNIRIDKEEK